ncbi:MAG: HlyD family efflux transporter periplasmic adaptor subunit [Pseudomonadota bacterium]
MLSLRRSLKLWLKTQCQMTDHCSHGLLVRKTADEHQLIAKWPESEVTEVAVIKTGVIDGDAIDDVTLQALAQVLTKQRLHIAQLNEQQTLLAQPIIFADKYWGTVVLRLKNNDKKNIQASLMLLQRGMLWLQFILHQQGDVNEPDPEPTSSPANIVNPDINSQATHLLNLLNTLLKENLLGETAISLVNILATQVQAVRVSLGLQTPKGIKLTAVSFSANFDHRTEAMQIIVNAMDEAADQRVDIHCFSSAAKLAQASPTTDAQGAIERCHEQLLQLHKLNSLHTFLLRNNDGIIGVITIEEGAQNPFTPEQYEFIQLAVPAISDLLALKCKNAAGITQNIKTLLLQKSNLWFGARQVRGKIIAATALTFLCVLIFPANYWITNDASLQSINKYLLVAPQEGYLSIIKARPGDLVKRGDLLAQLNDDALRLERRKLASQMVQSQQEYDNALANANRALAAIANEKVDQANIQLRLIEQQLERTQLVAPTDGIIISDDISSSLGAPVKQGQVLFEIAAEQGYLVQLFVDERDISALQVGQTGHIKLTSLPTEVFAFTLKTITPISEVRNGRNFFRVEANLHSDSTILRPGMTGPGKILAGRHSLGWIWFHDIWYWLRLKFWW